VLGESGERELDCLGRGVEHDAKRRLPLLQGPEHVGQEPALREIPILLGHLGRLRGEPQDAERAVCAAPLDEAPRSQLREAPPQSGELRHQLADVLAGLFTRRPVHPAKRVVLAISIVVAVLAVADLVPGQQQRHALRQHHARQQIAPQLPPQLENVGIVRRPFDPAIGTVVVVGAVAIVLAVGLVVLALVADEVGQGETVVDGDVVDARARAAAGTVEQVGGAGHATGEIADQVAVRQPIAPHRVAKMVVPLRPAGGKRAHLIAAGSNVPRLRDQLGPGQNGILPNGGEEGGAAIEPVRSATERAGEIEPEAVDMAGLDPIAQRIHDHLQHARVGQVERVAAAGHVVVVAGLISLQPVVGCVVDAAEAQRRAEMIAFGGVIVDDVEDHLDAGVVQARDRGAELVERAGRGIARLQCKEAERIVAPVIAQSALDQMPIIDEGMNRQELDRRHPEPFEMIDHHRRRERAEGAPPRRRHILALLGQSFDMRLVDDGVLPGGERPAFLPPGECFVDDHGLEHSARVVAPVE
jgi:hypothetical protein